MVARTRQQENARYLGTRELCEYLSIGQNTARSIGKEAGARIKIGRRVVFDKNAIDRYLEGLRA